jgi:type II secretory pathway pseudopilin PulG
MEAYDEPSPATSPATREPMKLPLWVTLVLLGLLLAVIAWRQYAVVATERRFEAERQELTSRLTAEKQVAVARARQALTQQTEDALKLFGTALGWTVRSAMMRNNRDEIDQYFTELVKRDRVRLALLADPDGKVLVSSDRNFQGSAFAQHFPAALLQEPTVAIQPGEGQLRRLVVPVHGLSQKLGTVLLVYDATSIPSS